MNPLRTQRKELLSVGIDVGTTTSHMIFSRLVLEKDVSKRTEKFEIVERMILHEGLIHLTPFSSPDQIDFARLKEMLAGDYARAGVEPSSVDTGAVIITGESARKHNAQKIVEILAGESGKFVAATAGPNFESVIAAFGSGAVKRSSDRKCTVMNVDIGGGSSNIAVCREGRVIDTAAINVGGRLVAFDAKGIIHRLEQGGRNVADSLGFTLALGGIIDESIRKMICEALAGALFDALRGEKSSELTQKLMMTPALTTVRSIDEIAFSGGVAEYRYNRESGDYGDLGRLLAESIKERLQSDGWRLVEPEYKIRATVIGAGQSSLRVSGSTTFLSAGISYPIRNLPAVVPVISRSTTSSREVADAISGAIRRLDLVEGEDRLLLAFSDAVRPSYESLTSFAKGVVLGLPKTVARGEPILMCFDGDIGNSVGNVMKRETGIKNDILSIDEVALSEGDFVDIGEPIIENVVVPVVVKTLVFGAG